MKAAPFALLFALAGVLLVHATQIKPKSLKELVKDADHLVSGTVEKVDMVDETGKEIVDLKARTGPKKKTQIRLHVLVDEGGWLKTSLTNPPARLVIPLWQMWHYILGDVKKATEGQPGIFLLKSESFEPVYPAGFHYDPSYKKKLLSAWKKKEKAQSRREWFKRFFSDYQPNSGFKNVDSAENIDGGHLIASNDCLTCHKVDEQSVGPSYKAIAAKYELNQGNIENLANKIIKGGKGLWGDAEMTPHLNLPYPQANEMARYILSLREPSDTIK